MFNRQTLFVVGAGASFEAGLPVGFDLAAAIGRKVSVQIDHWGNISKPRDPEFVEQLRRTAGAQFSAYVAACNVIENGIRLANSIDDFLDIHKEDAAIVEVGKAAIASAILAAEKKSSLALRSDTFKLDHNKLDKTWFSKFMRVLGPGIPKSAVARALDNVAFIVFNYDRCVEHFLVHALTDLYAIKKADATAIVSKATIIHPYGSIGEFDRVGFGSVDQHQDCIALSKSIKTYTEQIEEGDTLKQIRDEVRRAKCIVFLGFAYHNQNMSLIKPAGPFFDKHVFGTAYGMSDADQGEVVDQLASFFPEENEEEEGDDNSSDFLGLSSSLLRPRISINNNANIHIENKLTCADLFHYYAKSLAG